MFSLSDIIATRDGTLDKFSSNILKQCGYLYSIVETVVDILHDEQECLWEDIDGGNFDELVEVGTLYQTYGLLKTCIDTISLMLEKADASIQAKEKECELLRAKNEKCALPQTQNEENDFVRARNNDTDTKEERFQCNII